MSRQDAQELQALREHLQRLGVPPVDARGEERPTYQMWLDLAAEVHWLRLRVQEAAQDVLAVSRAMGRIREVLITEGGMEDDDRSTVDMVREALALRADASQDAP